MNPHVCEGGPNEHSPIASSLRLHHRPGLFRHRHSGRRLLQEIRQAGEGLLRRRIGRALVAGGNLPVDGVAQRHHVRHLFPDRLQIRARGHDDLLGGRSGHDPRGGVLLPPVAPDPGADSPRVHGTALQQDHSTGFCLDGPADPRSRQRPAHPGHDHFHRRRGQPGLAEPRTGHPDPRTADAHLLHVRRADGGADHRLLPGRRPEHRRDHAAAALAEGGRRFLGPRGRGQNDSRAFPTHSSN